MYSLTSLRQARNFSATSLLRFYSRPNHAVDPVLANLPGCLENEKRGFCSYGNVARVGSEDHMLRVFGNLGLNLCSVSAEGNATSAPYALGFRKFVHSTSQKDFETGRSSRPMDFETGRSSRPMDFATGRSSRSIDFENGRSSRPLDSGKERSSRPMDFVRDFENGRSSRPMDFVRGIIEEDRKGFIRRSNLSQDNVNADFVHIKLMRNNTFVTVTDSKGNKKIGASSGCIPELKGGPKMSRYVAEATSEHVGRLARNMGLKSVVMRVKGFTYFKKKRQAIMSFREGFSNSRGDQNPIVYIEDTTRKPHNGCRLPKKRRI